MLPTLEIVILSSVRLPEFAPRRVRRTWVPVTLGASSDGLNRWTRQIPSAPDWSVVKVPGGAVNAAVDTAVVVADWTPVGNELTICGALSSKPSTMAKTRYSCVVPAMRLLGENVLLVGLGRGMSVKVPPTRSWSLNSVATVDALVQNRSIWLLLTAVARKFAGVAGKTVAEEMSEGSESGTPSPCARTW